MVNREIARGVKLRGVFAASVCVALGLVLAGITPTAAAESDDTLVLAQAQDKDRDQDRDWSDADRDRIRDQLRDGTCQEVTEAADEVLAAIRPCLDRDRLRDESCMDRVGLGLEALQRTREACRNQ
jgi:hypothetical protein